jgi:hypothetical protein
VSGAPFADRAFLRASPRNSMSRRTDAFFSGGFIGDGSGCGQPLSKSKGQVVDHIGLSYPDLDAVMAHLKASGVPILQGPYKLADARALMIEDLDGLGLELVEVKP